MVLSLRAPIFCTCALLVASVPVRKMSLPGNYIPCPGTSDGLYPDLKSCTHYLDCIFVGTPSEMVFRQECPPDRYFNPERRRCERDKTVCDKQQTGTTHEGSLLEFLDSQRKLRRRSGSTYKCPGETDGLYPDPDDCSYYLQCVHMESFPQVYRMACPPSLVFNPSKNICDWPSKDLGCHKTSTTTSTRTYSSHSKHATTRTITPHPPALFKSTQTPTTPIRGCPGHTDGFYPDPTDCSYFIRCVYTGTVHEQVHRQQCPSGLYFNPTIESCDWPRNVMDCPKTTTKSTIPRLTKYTTTLHSSTPPRKTTTESIGNRTTKWHSTMNTKQTTEAIHVQSTDSTITDSQDLPGTTDTHYQTTTQPQTTIIRQGSTTETQDSSAPTQRTTSSSSIKFTTLRERTTSEAHTSSNPNAENITTAKGHITTVGADTTTQETHQATSANGHTTGSQQHTTVTMEESTTTKVPVTTVAKHTPPQTSAKEHTTNSQPTTTATPVRESTAGFQTDFTQEHTPAVTGIHTSSKSHTTVGQEQWTTTDQEATTAKTSSTTSTGPSTKKTTTTQGITTSGEKLTTPNAEQIVTTSQRLTTTELDQEVTTARSADITEQEVKTTAEGQGKATTPRHTTQPDQDLTTKQTQNQVTTGQEQTTIGQHNTSPNTHRTTTAKSPTTMGHHQTTSSKEETTKKKKVPTATLR